MPTPPAICLLLALVLGGCDGCSPALRGLVGMRPMKRLVPPAQITKMKQDFQQTILANSRRRCLRPVLRGEARDGSARALMLAVREGTPTTARCHRMLVGSLDINNTLLLPQRPGHWLQTARPLGDPAAFGGLAGVLATTRPGALATMQAAVAHEDACNPYLPGVRGAAPAQVLLNLSKATGVTAHRWLSTRHQHEAAKLLMDALRFNQDMRRGGVDFVEGMISVAAMSYLVPVVELLLNSPAVVDDKLLDQLQRELGLLLESEPHPSSMIQGDLENMILNLIRPNLEAPGWTPPGGWGDNKPPRDDGDDDHLHPHDFQAIAWLASLSIIEQLPKVCPGDSLPATCHRGMLAMVKKPETSYRKMMDMVRLLSSVDREDVYRRKFLKIMQSSMESLLQYVPRSGAARFLMATMRLHVVYRRLAQKQQRCPDLSAFDRAPLKALRTDPYSGNPMRISRQGADLVVSPSRELSRGLKRRVVVRIRCTH